MNIIDQIIFNYSNNKSLYIGEKVTMSEHMIQTAMLAEKTNCSSNLVCSSLLHDYGHFILENPNELIAKDKDGRHEDVGYEFLKKYFNQFDFAIVSGSDQKELRAVCKGRGIDSFFKMILGSPIEKKDNIATLLSDFKWDRNESLYIGDSNNDLEAAKANNIDFIGRSSGLVDWEGYNVKFVSDLSSLYNFLH